MKPLEIVAVSMLTFGAGMVAQYFISEWKCRIKSRANYYEGWMDSLKVNGWKSRRRNSLGQFEPKRKGGAK
jgi:hypothetical protein